MQNIRHLLLFVSFCSNNIHPVYFSRSARMCCRSICCCAKTGHRQLESLRRKKHKDFAILEAFDRGEIDDETASLINNLDLDLNSLKVSNNSSIDVAHLVLQTLPDFINKIHKYKKHFGKWHNKH